MLLGLQFRDTNNIIVVLKMFVLHFGYIDTAKKIWSFTPSSIVLGKLTISAVIPLKHPATTYSFGSLVKEVI